MAGLICSILLLFATALLGAATMLRRIPRRFPVLVGAASRSAIPTSTLPLRESLQRPVPQAAHWTRLTR